MTITLRESTAMDELLRLVDPDEADVALLPGSPPDHFTVTAIAVAEEEIVPAAPTGHPPAERPEVRLADLEGAPLVHFAPDNGLSGWLDRSLARAGVHPDTVMRTSVTTAAPQLAAAGLGLAVCPVSAVSDGFPGAVRSFSPRWVGQLVAVTSAEPDPLLARFLGDLRGRGVRVPREVRTQLARSGPTRHTGHESSPLQPPGGSDGSSNRCEASEGGRRPRNAVCAALRTRRRGGGDGDPARRR